MHDKKMACKTRLRITQIFKGAFYLESQIRFQNLPISQKNYSKKLSWAWNLKFPPISVKNSAQDSFFEFFLGDSEILKTNLTFWKKITFSYGLKYICLPHWAQTCKISLIHLCLHWVSIVRGRAGLIVWSRGSKKIHCKSVKNNDTAKMVKYI
jgi:hypothetical protein